MFWLQQVPLKVKNTAWRAITGCLPTRVQLRIKKVQVPLVCPFCELYNETIFHCFVSCFFLSYVLALCWAGGEIDGVVLFGTWLRDVLNRVGADIAARVLMICWSLWNARNDIICQENFCTVSKVVESAKVYLDQWLKAQEKTNVLSLGPVYLGDRLELWTKPDIDGIKIKVDATTFDDIGKIGLGIIARDHYNVVLTFKSWCKFGVMQVEMAEAMELKEVLSWIKMMHWQKVIIEMDSLVVVQAITKR
ncbi:uncharacterized protein LOC133039350 [Cannabis sativa]|uniref:uncharacterized protein LOC133039350 n=1 Tax=Cannabis sativa TaxID=3483 RepID=UPI0029CA8CFB|nr:uncharacterized protein LOC133039350 [Cannabis sativa]